MMFLICASPKSSAEKKAQIKVDINSKDDAACQAYGAMAAALRRQVEETRCQIAL